MPIYEYSCNGCGHVFDVLILSTKDPEPGCPECNTTNVKKLMSAGTILSGTSSDCQTGAPGGGCSQGGGCMPQGG